MHNSRIGPQSVHSTQNNTSLANHQGHCILCKNSAQTLEFPNEVRSLGHSHITQAKDEEPNAEQGHRCCSSSLIFQRFGMSSIIQVSNTQEQCRTPHSVCLHCHNSSNNPNFIHCKQSQNHHTHVRYTTVCYYFFLVNHTQCCQTPINNTNLTNCRCQGPQISTPFGKHVQVKAQLSVSSQFQQYSPQLHTSSSAPFNVSFGLPLVQRHQRHFHCKCLEEAPPLDVYHRRLNRSMRLQHVGSCSPPALQQQYAGKHCQTSNQGIKNLLICCAHFSSTTSSKSNQLEHGQQRAFVEHIKAQSVQPCESPKQETFQSQLLCIEGLTMHILSIPTTQHRQGHLGCCEQYHPKTQAIQPEFLLNGLESTPHPAKPYNVLERLCCCWHKSSPLAHTQYQSYQTKNQCKKTMFFAFFSWNNTQLNRSLQGKSLNCEQLSLYWDIQRCHCSQHTHTLNLRPHCLWFWQQTRTE